MGLTTEGAVVQILPETVEDLVDASPMSSGVDGSLVLGSKDTTLLLLDAATGELLEEVSAFGGRIMQIADLLSQHSLHLLPLNHIRFAK